MDKLANANSQFALDLFQKLKEAHPTGNVFFSPLSLSSALAMVALGARGNTASELLKTLHFDGVEDLHSVFHMLNAKINRSNAPYILKLANRLYGEKTFNFLSDFLTSIQNLYGAKLSTVDFSNAPDKARKEINQWVKKQTEGKIPELLSEGSINEMTKLVLVNAVYFKGNWEKVFKEKNTEEKPFRLNKAEKKNVRMMFMKEKLPFGYIPECKCRVLELPYKGKDLSMIILLPDSIEDNSTGLEERKTMSGVEKCALWFCKFIHAEVRDVLFFSKEFLCAELEILWHNDANDYFSFSAFLTGEAAYFGKTARMDPAKEYEFWRGRQCIST